MNRINFKIGVLVIMCMVTAGFIACDDSGSDGATADFVGTWLYSDTRASTPESVTFTLNDYVIDWGTDIGTFEVDIISYDEESNHIYGTCLNDDIWEEYQNDPVYLTYGITEDGTRIDFDFDFIDYPDVYTYWGPFIKQ